MDTCNKPMKKILFMLLVSFSLTLTSCVTSLTATPQDIHYYDDYVYLGVTYPVLYVNSVPHYFCGERWIVVPTNNYHCLRHYNHPMTFRGTPPRNWMRPHRHGYRPMHHKPHRPPMQHKPDVKPQPARPNPNIRPRGYSNNGNIQRPNSQRGNTPSRGGRR